MEADSPYFGLTTDSVEAVKRRTEEEKRRKKDLAAAQKKAAEEEKRRQSLARLDKVSEEVEALAKIKRDLVRDRSFKRRRELGETTAHTVGSLVYFFAPRISITYSIRGFVRPSISLFYYFIFLQIAQNWPERS